MGFLATLKHIVLKLDPCFFVPKVRKGKKVVEIETSDRFLSKFVPLSLGRLKFFNLATGQLIEISPGGRNKFLTNHTTFLGILRYGRWYGSSR